MALKPGDVVYDRQTHGDRGLVRMTVEAVHEFGVECLWFDSNGGLGRGVFPAGRLGLVSEITNCTARPLANGFAVHVHGRVSTLVFQDNERRAAIASLLANAPKECTRISCAPNDVAPEEWEAARVACAEAHPPVVIQFQLDGEEEGDEESRWTRALLRGPKGASCRVCRVGNPKNLAPGASGPVRAFHVGGRDLYVCGDCLVLMAAQIDRLRGVS